MKIPSKIEQYIVSHSDQQDAVLSELEKETCLKVLNPRMLSGHLQGMILSMFSQMIRPSSILEIGTYTGYSAICLAKGLSEGGKLITIERNDELEAIASKYFYKAGINRMVEQHFGDALDIIPILDETFDLVFIDAEKREYKNYYELVFDKVVNGGWIIADNTLWDGKVVNSDETDPQTTAIQDFNLMVVNDSRVEKIILPIRDGITIIRKKMILTV